MKNLYVLLATVAAVILFAIIANIATYEDRILSKNKIIRSYKRHNDPRVRELASNFKVRYDLKWYQKRSYLKELENLIEKIQNYILNNKSIGKNSLLNAGCLFFIK